jgi:hypothetical protein
MAAKSISFSSEVRIKVYKDAANGVPPIVISKELGCTKRMLYYRCGDELRAGYAEAKEKGLPLPRNAGGNQSGFKITEEDRELVRDLAGYGLRNDQVANVMGMGKMTLIAHYQEDLEVGRARAINTVAKTLYAMATDGEHPNETKFYLKTQAGWKEATQIEFPDENGRPQPLTGPQTVINLSADKMQALIAILNESV